MMAGLALRILGPRLLSRLSGLPWRDILIGALIGALGLYVLTLKMDARHWRKEAEQRGKALALAEARAATCSASIDRLAAEARVRTAEVARLREEADKRAQSLDRLSDKLAASARQPRGPGCAPSQAASEAWKEL